MAHAVALHGNGNMTIHEGEFKKGLTLMEQSIATFPTPLPYRKVVVYWNSEGDAVKTDYNFGPESKQLLVRSEPAQL